MTSTIFCTPSLWLLSTSLISTFSILYIIGARRSQPIPRESVSPKMVCPAAARSDHTHTTFKIPYGQHFFKHSYSVKFGEYYFANGAYADMWMGTTDNVTVAVKVWRGISVHRNTRQIIDKQLSEQLDQWKRCTHVNIVPLLGVIPRTENLPSLVTPYYKNENVMQYMTKHDGVDKFHLINGVAAGLSYLHSLSITHGDIKGSNVLVDDAGNACLSDVSISRVSFPSDWTQAHGTGSARWMAPELIDPRDEGGEDYAVTPHTDVYSFGMTVLEILTGGPPFAHRRHDTSVISDVYNGRRPRRPTKPEVTDTIWEIIQNCWHQEPTKRPSISYVGFWLTLLHQTRSVEAKEASP